MSLGLVRDRNTDLLFCFDDWSSVQRSQLHQIHEEIMNYDGNRLLNTAESDLIKYFVNKYQMNVPTLLEEDICSSQDEERRSDREYRNTFLVTFVTLDIPFTGDATFFKIQPQTYSLNPPRAQIKQNNLILRIDVTNLDSQQVQNNFENTIKDIKENLEQLKISVKEFNNSLENYIQKRLVNRRNQVLANRNLVASLKYPMKSRNDDTTCTVPEIKRKIVPQPPQASTKPFAPEPTLAQEDFEHILTVIENMTKVMERTPQAFCNINEEDLRSHYLVQLNGHYEWDASAETFNKGGKTDILIRKDGKTLFIAECKFWKGEKSFLATIDQLLGYLSWRDTKSAIIIFNRNQDLTNVLKTIEEMTPTHPNYKKKLRKQSETQTHYLFSHKDDPNREMTIAILVFEVPSKDKSK